MYICIHTQCFFTAGNAGAGERASELINIGRTLYARALPYDDLSDNIISTIPPLENARNFNVISEEKKPYKPLKDLVTLIRRGLFTTDADKPLFLCHVDVLVIFFLPKMIPFGFTDKPFVQRPRRIRSHHIYISIETEFRCIKR